jgi:hypothetical protein
MDHKICNQGVASSNLATGTSLSKGVGSFAQHNLPHSWKRVSPARYQRLKIHAVALSPTCLGELTSPKQGIVPLVDGCLTKAVLQPISTDGKVT